MVSQTDFPRRGEIWLAEFPDDPKPHPALIVSTNARNQFANSILVVPITSNLRPADTHVLLPRGQGGLHQDSMARCENVTYIRRMRLRRSAFGQTINVSLMRQVETALMRAFGIVSP